MPSRNTLKEYREGCFYHLYNRGVEKRDIFLDEQDYAIFLHLLKYFLSPADKEIKNPLVGLYNLKYVRPRPLDNLAGKVELHAFCLMPNHFHLLIKLLAYSGMTELMQKVLTAYSMYFNKRYKRVGHLFQGRYKAALVDSGEYLTYLTKYIHENPLDLGLSELTRTVLVNYPYSSYAYYLREKHASWLNVDYILGFFSEKQTYQEFVEDIRLNSKNALGPKLIID
jgi:putative transposase